jgi:hypothetical protein
MSAAWGRGRGKTLARNQWERLDVVGVGIAFGDLQCCLMLEAIEGVGMDTRNP